MRPTAWLMLMTIVGGAATAAQEPAPPDPPLQRTIEVTLDHGTLQVADLARALLDAYELDAGALRLPDARLDLRGGRGALVLFAARKLLLDTVRLRRDLADDLLIVTIDRVRAREVRRELRTRLALFVGRLAGEAVEVAECELALPADLDRARPLCVLVHGVESDAGVWSDLSAFLREEPRCAQIATLTYPNDFAVERVAAELAARLRALGDQRVVLIGHSMGGLIARLAVENATLDPGNVCDLVLLGTPNHGSNLAGFRFALEVADALARPHGTESSARELLAATIDHWRDGLGQAGGDLLPGSVCLTRLARMQRNPRVRYHVVLGSRSVLQPDQLGLLRERVRAQLDDAALTRLLRPRLERWLEELDELVDGEGDGAVSLARGALEGVEPLIVPLDHVGLVRLRGVLGHVATPEQHPVFAQVAAWIAAAAK
jgi:pimeloyl-ACP methyl ester carboxylesterase